MLNVDGKFAAAHATGTGCELRIWRLYYWNAVYHQSNTC